MRLAPSRPLRSPPRRVCFQEVKLLFTWSRRRRGTQTPKVQDAGRNSARHRPPPGARSGNSGSQARRELRAHRSFGKGWAHLLSVYYALRSDKAGRPLRTASRRSAATSGPGPCECEREAPTLPLLPGEGRSVRTCGVARGAVRSDAPLVHLP